MLSDPVTDLSPLRAARLTGALWLIVIVASVASGVTTHPLDWRADSAALMASATSQASVIRLAFAVFFFGKICYIGVTVLLYELLKPINKTIALFGAFCGLAGLLTGIGSINDFTGLSLLEESRRVTEPLSSQLQSTAKTIVATHSLGSGGEIVFFGCQIAAIGFLTMQSTFIPRAIGIVLILGGLGFLVASFTNFLSPALGHRVAPLVLPIAVVGEGSLAVWLLVRGINVDRWRAIVVDRSDTSHGVV